MKTIYLNWNGPTGKETVDEFSIEPTQSMKDFRVYVREMVKEYNMAGMDVYRSSRPCSTWRDKP